MCSLSTFFSSSSRPMPILTFPGASLIGASVGETVRDAGVQVRSAEALHHRYGLSLWLSGMDLSVEAEEFGARIRYHDDETPAIIDRLVDSPETVKDLQPPEVGSKRSAVYLEGLARMVSHEACRAALGGMIGPFSLAGRLFGLSELMMALIMEPDLVHSLLNTCTAYLVEYARAQKKTGAVGTMLAEPSAGLVGPDTLSEFSLPYLKRIVEAVQDENFGVILHNCAAKVDHLEFIYALGAAGYHFGATMDLSRALAAAPREALVMGNLDPARLFCSTDTEGMEKAVQYLLERCAGYPNFVLSSGCDIPASSPLETIDAFFRAAGAWSVAKEDRATGITNPALAQE